MALAQIFRFTAAAALGVAMGLIIAAVQTLADTSVIGVVLARILGWGWGWSAPLVLVGYLMARRWRREGAAQGQWLTVGVVTTMAAAALSAHVAMGPGWSWWGFGALTASPLLGLLGWSASSASLGGVLTRTLVPAAAIAEAVLLAPGVSSTGRVAWFELVACGVMLWAGVIATIFTAGMGLHAGVSLTGGATEQPSIQPAPSPRAGRTPAALWPATVRRAG